MAATEASPLVAVCLLGREVRVGIIDFTRNRSQYGLCLTLLRTLSRRG